MSRESNPDRDAQFEHINAAVIAAQAAVQPAISVDTKKNGGSDYRRTGSVRIFVCARAAEQGLPTNRFASIVNGRLKHKKRDALAISRAVTELRATIAASLPRVRIEDLLQDVDEWCRFMGAFQPLGGYQPRGADLHRSLLATVIAHGTNLGLAAMSAHPALHPGRKAA